MISVAGVVPEQTFNGYQVPRTTFYNLPIDYAKRIFDNVLCSLATDSLNTYVYFQHNTSDPDGYVGIIIAVSMIQNARVYNTSGPWASIVCNQSFTLNGATAYFGTLGVSTYPPKYETYVESGVFTRQQELAWLILYGGYTGYSVTYDLVACTGDSSNPDRIAPTATITTCNFTVDVGYAFNSGSVWIDGSGVDNTPIQYTFDSETGLLRVGVVTSDIVIHVHGFIDPYNDPDNPDLIDGESDIPGGDSISVPGLPGIGVASTGMVGLYNPTVTQMQLLADYMWTDFGGSGSTTEDILKEIVQAIKRSISNPLDYVIGLNIIPSQGLSVGSSANIRFGFVNSNVSMPRLTSQYFTVDCGSLSFDKLCGDTFLDYAPYSKFSLYLPYIGVKEMDANDFVGHTISILYHGDVVTGGVTAYVLKDGSVMYQYSGCCALTVPLNADSWGTTISAAIQIATTVVGGAALSSAGKGFAAKRAGVMAATGAAEIASNPSLLSAQVMRSGAISGGAGCMASQKPFVIREAVRFHTTQGFNTISGYPSYYYKPLSTMHGFTSVLDVHLHGIQGTHQELAEIENLLKEGVIL